MSLAKAFTSSIGKKIIMSLTGFFLITFLIVHCAINACIFANDGGELFNEAAHFMGTNILIRSMEIVLFIGLLSHIVQGLLLWKQNEASRPVKFAVNNGNANSKWYSRSMGLLGTILLMFLIIHLRNFWVESRFGGLEETTLSNGKSVLNLYEEMEEHFSSLWLVILYVLAMGSLAYHLLHGFKSTFQSLGLNHKKYTPIISVLGTAFSIIVPLVFAAMPVYMYLISK
jgi:succinate dehydrogenase / fumarate reductase cytochrome b subunit